VELLPKATIGGKKSWQTEYPGLDHIKLPPINIYLLVTFEL